VGGQLYDLAIAVELLLPSEKEGDYIPDLVWTFWRRDESVYPVGKQTIISQECSL
jgi:hypothetical protein